MKNYTTIKLVAFLVMLLAFNFKTVAQDSEPNNSIATASTLALNASVTGDLFINPANDADDFYAVVANENGSLTATADFAAGLTTRLRIFNAAGSQLAISGSVAGPGVVTLTEDCLPDATYYIWVERLGGSGTYTLSNSYSSPTLAEDLEPNNSIATAQTFLIPNDLVTGHLGYGPDNDDFYGLLPGDDGNITITANFDGTMTARLRLFYKNGTQISISNYGTGEVSTTGTCLANDSIYIWVERGSGCGSYDLLFEVDTPPTHDQDVEPNNSIATANVFLEPNQTVEGREGYIGVGISDNDDFYGLLPGDDGNITITANIDETMTARLRLFYNNGTQISISNYGNGEVSTTGTCLANDTIYIWVERGSGCGSYDLLFEVDTPPTHDQDVEPNNSIATANVFLEPNQTVQGREGYVGVGISDNDDFYGLLPGDDGNITVTANIDETMTARLRLFYKNGTQISISNYGNGEFSTTGTCLANDTIYIWVERGSGCGSYDLLFEVDTPPTHDQDVEPNNSIATANVFLEPNQTVQGREGYIGVGISDNDDFYGLLPGDDGSITITANIDETMTARLRLFYKNGSQISISNFGNGEISTTGTCLANDSIYIWIERGSGCGSYDLLFETTPPTFDNDVEPNSSVANANMLLTGEKVQGHLGYNGVGITDPGDFYAFEVVQAPFELDAKIEMVDGLSTRLRLLNAGGSQLAITNYSNESLNLTQTINSPGTYHIWVELGSSCGSYVLGDICGLYPTVNASPPGPLNKCPEDPVDLDATAGLAAYAWFNDEDQVGDMQQYSATSSGDYSVIGYDINGCPDTSNVVVISALDCDDGDPCTDDFCDPEDGCSNIFSGDDDGDGTCNNLDLCPNDPNKIDPGNCGCGAPEPGATCDDGDENTSNDIVQSNCTCQGTLDVLENDALSCTDGLDNDGDELIDCDDPDCIELSLGCSTCFDDGISFADAVLDYNNTCPGNTATNPLGAIGLPDYVSDDVNTYVSLGEGGYVTLAFTDNTLINSGDENPDLFVFEIGPIVEGSSVELRPLDAGTELALINTGILDSDNDGFYEFGTIGGSTASVDIDAFVPGQVASTLLFDAVKITDSPGSCSGDTPGADIDGVCALSSVPCNIGETCDDGDETTINDVVQSDCSCAGQMVPGCMDDSACNYDPTATVDDASCVFAQGCDECDGNGGVTDNPEIGDACDDGDPTTLDDVYTACGVCGGTAVPGCTNSEACNYDSNATVDDESCVFAEGCDECDGEGGVTNNPEIGDACDDGDPTTLDDVYTACGVCGGTAIPGCTDSEACNYDSNATVDDESCVLAQGCDECDGNGGVTDNPEIGDACDDGDENTTGDIYTACDVCQGTSIFDCPALEANIGEECDDGNDDLFPGTVNDDCECEPGVEEFDCPELMVNLGDSCDDGDESTTNDVYIACDLCLGEPIGDTPPNDNPEGAELNTSDRLWGVPGWDTFEVGCATLSMPTCDGSQPDGDTWYKFVAESENQGILARPNPSDPNAPNVDIVVQVFDENLIPLGGLSDGTCNVDRSCFNNYGNGAIERCVPSGLIIGETYFYRVYDANGGSNGDCSLLLDTKVKTYAAHPIVDGCLETVNGAGHSWTIENPSNLYNIPPVPVFFVKMVAKDINGVIISEASAQSTSLPGGLNFSLSDFSPALTGGNYTFHAQNQVKMMANGCISAFWSQLGPGCEIEIDLSLDFPAPIIDFYSLNEAVLQIYPNPNIGEQVNISLDNICLENKEVIVEVYDLYGKRIYSEQFVGSEEVVLKPITFEEKLSSGIYLVRINVDGLEFSDKLLINR